MVYSPVSTTSYTHPNCFFTIPAQLFVFVYMYELKATWINHMNKKGKRKGWYREWVESVKVKVDCFGERHWTRNKDEESEREPSKRSFKGRENRRHADAIPPSPKKRKIWQKISFGRFQKMSFSMGNDIISRERDAKHTHTHTHTQSGKTTAEPGLV